MKSADTGTLPPAEHAAETKPRWRGWIHTVMAPLTLFGGYAILTGAARFLVEEVRLNAEALLGLTQPQLWSLVLVGIGIVLVVRDRSAHSRGRALPAAAAG